MPAGVRATRSASAAGARYGAWLGLLALLATGLRQWRRQHLLLRRSAASGQAPSPPLQRLQTWESEGGRAEPVPPAHSHVAPALATAGTKTGTETGTEAEAEITSGAEASGFSAAVPPAA